MRREVIELTLNREGAWRLANMSPGRYRIRLLGDFVPFRSRVIPAGSWRSYVARRYGLSAPVWEQAPDTIITVHPGCVTRMRPWRLIAQR